MNYCIKITKIKNKKNLKNMSLVHFIGHDVKCIIYDSINEDRF